MMENYTFYVVLIGFVCIKGLVKLIMFKMKYREKEIVNYKYNLEIYSSCRYNSTLLILKNLTDRTHWLTACSICL